MNTNIKHLEKIKQQEINKILEIILNLWKKYMRPEMIIVFGDYIKNEKINTNLVREGDILVEYNTIIEIFIITRKPAQEKNMSLSRNIISALKNEKTINLPVNIIIENIFSFNQALEEKRYFYLDLIREWLLIYDSKKIKIWNTIQITKQEIKQLQKQDFNHFFGVAKEFFVDYHNAFQRWNYKIALFYLHQVTEFLMTSYLLVKIWYKPKTHNLEILYSKLKLETRDFNNSFDLSLDNYYFELLKWSYINSRYKKNYEVNKKDLDILLIQIIKLSKKIKKLCLLEFKK